MTEDPGQMSKSLNLSDLRKDILMRAEKPYLYQYEEMFGHFLRIIIIEFESKMKRAYITGMVRDDEEQQRKSTKSLVR